MKYKLQIGDLVEYKSYIGSLGVITAVNIIDNVHCVKWLYNIPGFKLKLSDLISGGYLKFKQ